MKRIFSCVTFMFILFLFSITSLKAASMSFSPNNLNKGSRTTLSISGLEASASYSLSYSNGYGGVLSVSGNSCGSGTSVNKSGSCQITYNAVGSGTVTVSLIRTSGEGNDTVASAKVTVNGGNKNTTTKQTPKTTTKQTTKTQSTTTTALKSTNANLSKLVVKDQDGAVLSYTPEFKNDVYEYTVEALSGVEKIQLEPSMEDAKANLVISDNVNEKLKEGQTTKITITVTAEDGITKKAYNINVNKAALNSDATLKSLIISEAPFFKLQNGVYEYTVGIEKNVSTLTIKCIPNSETSKCSITGNSNLKNKSVVKVLVTAEDGSKKEYKINISKKSDNVKKITMEDIKDPLIIISLSIVAFALIGGIFYTVKR